MDDEDMKLAAEALLRKLLSGGDAIEIEEFPPVDGRGRRWKIRLLPGNPDAG